MSGRTHLPSGLVTFLFTDIEGSTRLAQMLGAGYRPVLHEHREVIRRALSKADGVELFTEGDSLFVAFADAAAALSACAEAQRALAEHDWPSPEARPKVRMGLHTGFAEPYGGEYTSPEVHRAARVAAAAHGGQVLCSAATAAHVGLSSSAAPIDPTDPGVEGSPLGHGAWLLDLGLHRLRGFDGFERIFQLVAPGLDRQFPRPRTIDAPAHNLPVQTTRFIGRAVERAAVRDLITRHRLVTVVGAGGAGKTRVAVEAAGEIVERFRDGVWFADLSAVANADLVDVAVAAALGLRPEPGRAVVQTIADHVRGRRLLVLLDTSDAQLPAARRLVARLLAAGPEVAVLATSREPLGLAGEVVWRIPPLSVEAASGGGFSDAVALLVDRASAARGGRPVEPGDIAHLTRVARALEGLPLALELAAARLRLLSAPQLADRIGDVLGTLDAGSRPGADPDLSDRHRTMQTAVGWSYRTLDERSARLLRWLSVFASPVDLPAIEWLHDGDPLDPLATLVDKSLLQAEAGATSATYRMLDPIRAYAARLLGEAGEEEPARERHVAWCLQAAHDAYLDGEGRPVTLSLYTLDPLADELRAALHWTVTRGSARQGLALAGALDQWWRERGLVREGRMWLFRLYERISATGEPVPDAELAAAYHMHSLHAGADGETVEELRFSQRAESAARRAGDPGLLARVLSARGAPLLEMQRTEEAERLARQVITWSDEQGVAGDALSAVFALAQLLWRRGDLDEAADLLASARPMENSRPLERGRRTVDMLLGMVALARGDLVAAHDHLIVALRSRMTHGFHLRVCETLNAVAVRCLLADDLETAARLFGAAQSARIRMRCSSGAFGAFWTEQQAALRAAMGDAAFDTAYAAGGALSLEESVALALTIEHPDLMAGSIRFSTVE
ncbi:adenylate/guanylate cyclase domain-containing protein [Dactylosporangium vinaceum]|uniref:Adenylate/guanylate cyclase domain-containing protein n=1 Tax=Dactylosporangium vinaceum TaxID=53362 RepID=A0ABV5M0L8_9ACTN|nr:adenylate/guanylate cyclase domain-containing protein [Dactylosporangium vinaceum]UAB97326.1 adenylate/guanylate cyclase domain-containing protein [Dactylosporangium vinaceum]